MPVTSRMMHKAGRSSSEPVWMTVRQGALPPLPALKRSDSYLTMAESVSGNASQLSFMVEQITLVVKDLSECQLVLYDRHLHGGQSGKTVGSSLQCLAQGNTFSSLLTYFYPQDCARCFKFYTFHFALRSSLSRAGCEISCAIVNQLASLCLVFNFECHTVVCHSRRRRQKSISFIQLVF